MRDGRLQCVQAIIERQKRMPAEGDDDRLFLDRQHRRSAAAFGPVRRSATELRAFHLRTVFWLMP